MKAGLSYRRRWRSALLADGEGPDVLEVMADHFFARPEMLDDLAGRYPIVVHDVGCSVVTGGPDPARLRQLRDVVSRARAVAFTDHLAMTVSPSGLDLGHLFPPWFTRDVLDTCVDSVRRLQDALGVPIALENVATPFVIPGELTEGEFWHGLVERTGCGWLVDVTNALLDARNDGTDPKERLARLPLHAARFAHLAGGRADGAWWVDSHSAPVEAASFALLRWVAERAPLEVVIVERDAHLPPLSEILAEARYATGGGGVSGE